jgi:hypothetical protein
MADLGRFRGCVTVVALFVTIVSATQAQYSGGTGEPNNPYQIATAEDLMLLGDSPEDYDKHFILTADIDLDPNLPGRKVFDKAVIAPDTNDATSWFDGTPFTGVFHGNGHRISHLTIMGESYLGLFGQLDGTMAEPELRDLGVVDVNIVGSGWCTGSLLGNSVYGGTVTQCHSTGLVIGDSAVGGLVGRTEGHVTHCYSSVVVSGGDGVGGLVGGAFQGLVTECYCTGAVSGGDGVGGLVGSSGETDVACSYATGVVSGTAKVGGLAGYAIYDGFTQCYSTGSVSGKEYVGGLVGSNGRDSRIDSSFWDIQASGQATSAGGTGTTTAEMQDPNTFMAVGWDFVAQPDGPHDIWAKPEGGGYPILWWQLSPLPELPFSGGTGGPDDPYLITSAEQLNSIGHNPRLMRCHFRLVDDLDLTGFSFYPIGGDWLPNVSQTEFHYGVGFTYEGTFDGNGHTISNLMVKGEGYLGLFGVLGDGSEVKNLGVVDANIIGSGHGGGALVGRNWGSVLSSYSTGTVNGDGWSVGGLVGTNYGSISECYSTCLVSGKEGVVVGGLVGRNTGSVGECYSAGVIYGNDTCGGLVGYNSGSVINCYGTATVIGMVNGEHVGGLVGWNWTGRGGPGTVTNSLWDTQTSGQTASDGGTGKTTTEVQTASTFLEAGWDFIDETENGTEDIWWILEGQDYPRLWWELLN